MIKEREYVLRTDAFKTPVVLENQQAIAILLMRLILLDPGSDPLHPDMGVGIRQYRYAMGKEEELKQRITQQIAQYLPCFPAGNVEFEVTPDKLINVKIIIDDTVYVYDSAEAPIPITLEDAKK